MKIECNVVVFTKFPDFELKTTEIGTKTTICLKFQNVRHFIIKGRERGQIALQFIFFPATFKDDFLQKRTISIYLVKLKDVHVEKKI